MKFKIAGLIAGLILVFLSGCTHKMIIREPAFTSFEKQMKETYAYIRESEIYFVKGPDSLNVAYTVTVNSNEEMYQACLEATQAFLKVKENRDLLGIEDPDYAGIKQVAITFQNPLRSVIYESYYYKPGPEGYQDNRYWTEDNVDAFETWNVWVNELDDGTVEAAANRVCEALYSGGTAYLFEISENHLHQRVEETVENLKDARLGNHFIHTVTDNDDSTISVTVKANDTKDTDTIYYLMTFKRDEDIWRLTDFGIDK